MEWNFEGELTDAGLRFDFGEEGKVTQFSPEQKFAEETLLLFVKERQIKVISPKPLSETAAFDQVIQVETPWELSDHHLAQRFFDEWQEQKLAVETHFETIKVPKNQLPLVTEYQEKLFRLFTALGYPMVKIKKKPAKAAHRWNKAVSQITFFIDHAGATGEAIWQKRNELVLKAGAKLLMEAPLNKDGSVSYTAKLTEKLREDNHEKINGDRTTEDIVFKSVNELSIFLYYAGTNSWLVLKDAEGKTIDSYTVVE